MAIDRRELLFGAAATAAMLALPRGVASLEAAECFAAARKDDRGIYSAAMFTLKGDLKAVELPGRGHDIALKPDGSEWVALARHPGKFGVAVPAGEGAATWFSARPDRHFYGHGAYSNDGKLLYATQNDYENARGIIGVFDATDGYKQVGEFPSHGLEPHDILMLGDDRTLVIANGGIETHPDYGSRELNLPEMKPSLVYVDVESGDLLEEQVLAPHLHQLSIRHLAVSGRDSVVFGCQYRGPETEAPPLVGFHRRGAEPVIVSAPAQTQAALQNYIGSVACDLSGSVVAASSPKGGLVTYWDVATRRYLGTTTLNDGCGLAPMRHSASFLLTSGDGWLVSREANGDMQKRASDFHWDNHAILVG